MKNTILIFIIKFSKAEKLIRVIFENHVFLRLIKYKPHFKGWKMTHNYKANNAFGIPIEQKTTFYFDIQLTKITGPEEIVEFARFTN